MKMILHCFFIILIAASQLQCEGDSICAATFSPSTDADSDCVADSSDNCIFVYNPAQVDENENDIGDACEPAPTAAFQAFMAQNIAQDSSSSPVEFKDCAFSLITCTGEALDLENQNFNGIFDDTNPCSAINTEASTPPELQCQRSDENIETLGYVTLNTSFVDAISPCNVFVDFFDLTKWCE